MAAVQSAPLPGPAPMMVDGAAADVNSLQQQAAAQADSQLKKSLGTDSVQELSLRQQMQQKMLQNEQHSAPVGDASEGYGAEAESLMPAQAPMGSVNPDMKAEADPHMTRMAFV
mmetsp:Transcript_23283/g.36434  ORF Transcript_23283/g.36434 Transcript_23283/m.36434 type:complete len:114 (-) Transcript_23283:762-1103(-)